jgi:hypothetical protein
MCIFGKLKFKMKPTMGYKGFFDMRCLQKSEDGEGPPFNISFEDGYCVLSMPIEGIKASTNDMVANVFKDKELDQSLTVHAKTGFNLKEALAPSAAPWSDFFSQGCQVKAELKAWEETHSIID